ncbi:MAG: TolC family protein [Acidobacteria bacterium]|nr:TolC family protein [Acidobacteriota bacterium]
MRRLLIGALPCLLLAQAPASPPLSPGLTFEGILSRAKPGLEQLRLTTWLAERSREVAGSAGFLREGPTLGLTTGPRRAAGLPGTSDQSADVDLPLFLSPGTRGRLVKALDQADPLLREAARREGLLRLRQAYLDAWLEQQVAHLRQQDLQTVEVWLKAAQVRLESGADPAFQVALVEGEILKAQLELADSRRRAATAWTTLRSQTDLPEQPVPLADPGPISPQDSATLSSRYQSAPLRRALTVRLEVERENLRHREALGLSRWSLRGSFAKEGEDRIAKVGMAYRFSRPGEVAAVRRETEAGLASLQRELELALAELDGRFQAAQERLQLLGGSAPRRSFQPAIEAVGLRLQSGRERPSDALPIRRQLLEAEVAGLRRQHAQHLVQAELQALTEGVTP